jgi:NAD+ dependent glucose-6-phosphate dehydrogenase
MSESNLLKVRITGAYGLIGNLVYRHLSDPAGRYAVYGSDRGRVASARADEMNITQIPDDHFRAADLADAAVVAEVVRGMDVVLHIGAVPEPTAEFQDILDSNVVGIYNVLEACRQEGVRRLVFTSSIMVNWGYFVHEEPYQSIRDMRMEDIPNPIPKITHLDPPRATIPYAASKLWGEALCRAYVDEHNMSIICLRMGGVNRDNYPGRPGYNSNWCSHRDVVNIYELALQATDQPGFDIFYAISDNQYRWVDTERARERLGFVAQDRAETALAAADLSNAGE